MTIHETKKDEKLTLTLEGRLDTVTAPKLEETLRRLLPSTKELTLDLGKLDYLSSAGLRVLLFAHKALQEQGSMKIIKANELVKEVFDVTGFSDILDIE